MVVTDTSLVGWLVSIPDSEPRHKIFGVLVAVAVITMSAFAVHRRIEQRIDEFEAL